MGSKNGSAKTQVQENGAGETQTPQRRTLIDVEQMHRMDVLTLMKRVEAANTRITAECTELRASQYRDTFEPEVVLARYEAIERQVTEAKRLLVSSAA